MASAGRDLAATSGPSALTAAIVLSKPRMRIVIWPDGLPTGLDAARPAGRRRSPARPRATGPSSIWSGPAPSRAAAALAEFSSREAGPGPPSFMSAIASFAPAAMSNPFSVAVRSIFDGVRSAAPGGASATGRLRPSADSVVSIALCGPALATPTANFDGAERDRAVRRRDHELRGFAALGELQARRGEVPQQALELRLVRARGRRGGRKGGSPGRTPCASSRPSAPRWKRDLVEPAAGVERPCRPWPGRRT